MDSGVETTQRIVITGAIVLAIAVIVLIGYSLYTKAKRAESELANRVLLDNQTKKTTDDASISLTGEARNSSSFPYDGLVQKKEEEATTTDFGVVNEVEATAEEEITPIEEFVPEEPTPEPEPEKKPAPVRTTYSSDRPLTLEEIRAIRQLPVDDSPSGNLQTSLEEQSEGQYKARY